jgi:hypothetical protein
MPGAVGINVIKDGNGTAIVGGVRMFDISGTGAGPWVPMSMLTDASGNQLIGQKTMALSLPVAIASDQGSVPTTAKSVLWNTGTSNNGLIASLLTLESTELNALTNTSIALSSVGGSSGLFTNANTGAAIYGEMSLTLGAIGSALSAGANIAGWFIRSLDSGSTFEQSSAAPPRAPDFIIPLPATTISAAAQFASGTIRLPSVQFKVLLQNNTGQTLAATSNTLKLAPIAQLD